MPAHLRPVDVPSHGQTICPNADGLRHTTAVRATQALIASIGSMVLLSLLSNSLHTLRSTSIVLTVASCVAYFLVMRLQPGRAFTAGFIYLLLFVFFHAGLLVSVAVGQEVELINSRDHLWFYSEQTREAALIATYAVLSYTAAYAALIRRPQPSSHSQTAPSRWRSGAGPAMTIAGVLAWFAIAISVGVSLFGTTYTEWLIKTEGTPTPYVYLLIGIGMGAAGASHLAWPRKLALTVFVAFAVPGFLMGLRGEVVIPAAAYVVSSSRARPQPLKTWMVLVPLLAFSAGSFVRETRTTSGALGSDLGWDSLNPLNGLTEIGYTIRPLSLVLERLEAGESMVGWGTYLSPFERLIGGALMGLPVLPVNENDAVFRTFVTDRVGPIGGSPAAEAYRSFGLPGVVVVMAAVAVTLALLERRPISTANDALVGMGAFPLFLWIRNDFTPVLLSALVIAVVWTLLYARSDAGSETSKN